MALLPDPNLPWPIPMFAVAVICEAENLRLRAYKCPAGKWTIGWGETDGVVPGMVWTREQADRRLCEDLTARTAKVKALLTEHAEPNQLGAMVSLAYNVGLGAFEKSTVLRCHNRGDFQGAGRAFALFNKARVDGVLQVLPGLTARRAAEAALYLRPEEDAPRQSMPQAVEAESSLAKSQIAQGGAITAGSAGIGVLTQAGEALQGTGEQLGVVAKAAKGIREAVDGLASAFGMSTITMVCLVLLVAGAAVVWNRVNQRRGGWA